MNITMKLKKLYSIFKLCRVNELCLIIPFALVTVLMLCRTNFNLQIFLFTALALSCGFMAGCAFNGLSDKEFDSQNPRTKNRPMAQETIKTEEVFIIIAILGAGTILFTCLVSPILILLLPIPAALCAFYSLSKRYTWFCHLLIGIVHAICPISVAIVFNEVFNLTTILITAVVIISTTETDLLYSIPDAKYDATLNLKSIPVVFGKKISMLISFVCYLLSLCTQVLLFRILSFGVVPIILICMANLILLCNHLFMYFKVIESKYILFNYQAFILFITMATVINVV